MSCQEIRINYVYIYKIIRAGLEKPMIECSMDNQRIIKNDTSFVSNEFLIRTFEKISVTLAPRTRPLRVRHCQVHKHFRTDMFLVH